MPIPPLDLATGNLPAGIHLATWEEIVATFGTTTRRLELLRGLREALELLKAAGCSSAYLDGSFVTAKDQPGDYDGCWSAVGIDPQRLDPVMLNPSAQKARFGGHLFVAEAVEGTAGRRFLDFFQRDRNGQPKGIIAIDVGALT